VKQTLINDSLMAAILDYGRRYRRGMLGNLDTPEQLQAVLLEDWWEALRFFFGRAFFQGRNDVVSQKVYDAAIAVLESPSLTKCVELSGEDFLDCVRAHLLAVIGRGKVGKAGDVEMVISTLSYAARIKDHNIVAQSIERIDAGEIGGHFVELQQIYQVGPKITAFYLRDVVSLFQRESAVPDEHQLCLQPVDVWVRRFAIKMKLVEQGASDLQVQVAILELSRTYGCSPLQLNQGIWYAGSRAYDLLLECLVGPPRSDPPCQD
jgi:hypothetical protein